MLSRRQLLAARPAAIASLLAAGAQPTIVISQIRAFQPDQLTEAIP